MSQHLQMRKVVSSNVARMGYLGEHQLMVVAFNSSPGTLYCYYPITKKVYEECRFAKSIGSHLHHHIIKGKFLSFKVEEHSVLAGREKKISLEDVLLKQLEASVEWVEEQKARGVPITYGHRETA